MKSTPRIPWSFPDSARDRSHTGLRGRSGSSSDAPTRGALCNPLRASRGSALVLCAEPLGRTRQQLLPVWLCSAFWDLRSDYRQPIALHGRPCSRYEHRSSRRLDGHDGVDFFRHRGLGALCARSIGLSASGEGDLFSLLPVRRNCFRSRIWSADCGSVRYKLLHAASSAMAGGFWNASRGHGRTVLVESYRLPGKLFYSDYPIPGLDLDGCRRCGTDEKSHGSAAWA